MRDGSISQKRLYPSLNVNLDRWTHEVKGWWPNAFQKRLFIVRKRV